MSKLDWYGTDPDAFIAHLWDYHYTFNKTMWVTEWACHSFVNASENEKCSEEGVAEFLNKTQSFMDQTDWVERYAWFGAMKDLQGVNEVRCGLHASPWLGWSLVCLMEYTHSLTLARRMRSWTRTGASAHLEGNT